MKPQTTKLIMKNILYIFILFPSLLFPTEPPTEECILLAKAVEAPSDKGDSLTNLEGESSALIYNCVNAISGQYCDFSTDLVSYGIEPLSINRTYCGNANIPGNFFNGWSINHFSRLGYFKIDSESRTRDYDSLVVMEGEMGQSLQFSAPYNKTQSAVKDLSIRSKTIEKGVTNTSNSYISAQTNIKNIHVKYADEKHYHVIGGDGELKIFELFPKSNDIYHITSQQKPNGNTILYDYIMPTKKDSVAHSKNVQVINKEGAVINQLAHTYMDIDDFYEKLSYKVYTKDRRWLKYEFVKRDKPYTEDESVYLISGVISSDSPPIHYSYNRLVKDLYIKGYGYQTFNRLTLSKKSLPNNRYIFLSYYDYFNNDLPCGDIYLENYDDPRIDRIKYIQAPAGADPNPIILYQIVYNIYQEPKTKKEPAKIIGGETHVFDYFKNKTIYEYDRNQRLKYIQKLDPARKLTFTEVYFWGKHNTKDSTCLLTKAIKANEIYQYIKTYTYDNRGNILTDTMHGQLTGNNLEYPHIDDQGNLTSKNAECYTKQFTYSDDGYNLLLSEKDGSQQILYEYYPGTNLLRAQFHGDNQNILKRTFYTYDVNGALASEIVDDGTSTDVDDLSNITKRKISRYTNRMEYPVGLPEIIEETYLDLQTGQEIPHRKLVNEYNNTAKITRQDHYDANGELNYTLTWTYDKWGNILTQNDALGHVTSYKYDENKNRVFEQRPDLRVHKEYCYDYMNRLIKEMEVHDDGICMVTSHRYDPMSRKIATVDPYGNETRFEHDAFGRVIRIYSPYVTNDHEEKIRVTTARTYDIFGNVTSETNGNGATTYYTYNIRGQLTSATLPDGSSEHNKYSLNGYLIESQATNGTKTKYTNDIFGRAVKIEKFSSDGTFLTSTTATYTSFHLIKETDGNGNITTYEYYPNGNLKSKTKGNSRTEYEYDALGRQTVIRDFADIEQTDGIVTVRNYDLLNRMVEERVEDIQGNIMSHVYFTYDAVGNIIERASCVDANTMSITTSEYNSHKIPWTVTDAEGNKTFTIHRYDYVNELKQYVPYKETIDSLGNADVIILDALGRQVQTYRKDPMGQIIRKIDNSFDAAGNLCLIKETIFKENNEESIVLTRIDYDSLNRVVATYEAAGTPDQQVVRSIYNSFGQKEKVIKADGVIINHTYDPLGRLKILFSSDKSIYYLYHYDANDNPIQADDLVLNRSTIRIFDSNNKLIEESLAHGFAIKYKNDLLGRPMQVVLPDQSSIHYQYHGCLLEQISRYDALCELKYTHRYLEYDLEGHILKMSLPGNSGELSTSYDLLGRPLVISTNSWKAHNIIFDAVGNLKEQTIVSNGEALTHSYSYNNLYQLTSENCDDSDFVNHNYTYDSHYNRQSKDGREYSHNLLHQLLDDSINTYSYDLNGNRTTKITPVDTIEYTYDALDRLVKVQKPDVITLYTYDESNRRLSKEILTILNDGTTQSKQLIYYLYQGQNEIGSCDPQGNIQELRVLGNGKGAEIGASISIEMNGDIYTPIHDLSGNIISLIDIKNGETIETYRYSTFGEQMFERAITPWRFASKRYDEETGFVYFGRRYYDAEVGRWITPDPLGREGGPNLYAYVSNSPLTKWDEYGLFAIEFSSFDDVFAALETVLRIGVAVMGCFDFGANMFRAEFPIPVIRDALCAGIHFARCGTLNGYQLELTREKNTHHVHKGPINGSKHLICVVPGIENDNKSAEEFAQRVSKDYGNIPIYYLNNLTHGTIWDVAETGLQKAGVPTTSVVANVKMIEEMLDKVGPDGQITIVAHSMGGQIVSGLRKYLTPEQLSQINVITLGSAKMIENGVFGSVKNYVCKRDFVPYITDPIGVIRGILGMGVNIQFIDYDGDPFSAHFNNREPYSQALKIEGKSYQKNNGG